MSKGSYSFSYALYWSVIHLARMSTITRIFVDVLAYAYYKVFRSNKFFYFQKRKFQYYYHPYNNTVASERIIEIPISKYILDQYEHEGKQILEMGNVLSHYFPTTHDILDKYEKGTDVINEDVVNFKPSKKYDLIISVSTMEHVGWTYGEKKNPDKFLKGVENLKKLLKNNGTMAVTFPLFYRQDLSELIAKKKMPFNKNYFMKRISFLNEWVEIGFNEAMKGNWYDKYFANANILYIGIYSKNLTFSSTEKKQNILNFRQHLYYSYRLLKSFFEYL